MTRNEALEKVLRRNPDPKLRAFISGHDEGTLVKWAKIKKRILLGLPSEEAGEEKVRDNGKYL